MKGDVHGKGDLRLWSPKAPRIITCADSRTTFDLETTKTHTNVTTTMADEENATRAPESDAQEVSGIPGDSKPDQGAASMGVGCLECTTYNLS